MHETLQANHARARTNNRTATKIEVEGKRALKMGTRCFNVKSQGK